MTPAFPIIYLARHGETEWSVSGRHTGLTDLPLTERGKYNAQCLGRRLARIEVGRVLTSPLQRAHETCRLAGFDGAADVDHDLVEWNYGDYEGLTRAAIRASRPDWHLFRDGCPGGESVDDIQRRADRVVDRLRALGSSVLLFSSGHFLRVLGARWCGLPVLAGRHLSLGTASLSVVGYDRSLEDPVISLWNDMDHLENAAQ